MMQGYVTKHMFVITVVFYEVNTHVLNLLWAVICLKFAFKRNKLIQGAVNRGTVAHVGN